MQWFYLIALLVSIAGLAIIDWRYKLAFWHNARQSTFVLILAVVVFVVWDIAGITLGIFHHGGSLFSLPARLGPEFPIEELFFLILLCYCTLIVYRGVSKWQRI